MLLQGLESESGKEEHSQSKLLNIYTSFSDFQQA